MNLKLDDSRNPLTQTEQKIKNAELAMSQAKLNGQPLGAQEWADFGNTWQQGVNYGLQPSAVIPQGSKYNIQNTDKGLNISAQVGVRGGQCGAFVNDCFGKRIVGDSYQQKMSLTDPSITMPTPGMAFVQAVGGKAAPYGHIGMVESVDYAKGIMSIVDSNWGSNEVIQRRTIPISSADGFIRPPNGQPVTAGTSKQVSGMTDAAILQAYEKAGKTFTSPSEASKAISLAKQTGFVPGGTSSTGGSPSDIADTIMKGNTGLDIDALPQGQRADVARELSLKKQEALKSGDTFGYLYASAGGKQLDSTAVESLGKAQNVISQLGALEETINSMDTGPVTNLFRSANPYDVDKVKLKAQLQAIVPNLARGVYGEVGVLTDQDINNYIQTLPNGASTEDQKKALLEFTKNTVGKSIENKLKNYAMSGYNVSGYTPTLEALGIQSKASKEASAAKTAEQIKGFLDFGKSLIQDHQTRTNKFIVPEDAPSINIEY
jgi:hypothetical protein